MNLSPHFSLEGMVATAHRDMIDANIDWARGHAANMSRLCIELLEPVRAILGNNVMMVTSGIRCPALNAVVGSRPGSAHIPGFAADFIAPAFGSPFAICRWLAAQMPAHGIQFDQLIYECTWAHISLIQPVSGAQRGEVLTLTGPGQYAQGIVLKATA